MGRQILFDLVMAVMSSNRRVRSRRLSECGFLQGDDGALRVGSNNDCGPPWSLSSRRAASTLPRIDRCSILGRPRQPAGWRQRSRERVTGASTTSHRRIQRALPTSPHPRCRGTHTRWSPPEWRVAVSSPVCRAASTKLHRLVPAGLVVIAVVRWDIDLEERAYGIGMEEGKDNGLRFFRPCTYLPRGEGAGFFWLSPKYFSLTNSVIIKVLFI